MVNDQSHNYHLHVYTDATGWHIIAVDKTYGTRVTRDADDFEKAIESGEAALVELHRDTAQRNLEPSMGFAFGLLNSRGDRLGISGLVSADSIRTLEIAAKYIGTDYHKVRPALMAEDASFEWNDEVNPDDLRSIFWPGFWTVYLVEVYKATFAWDPDKMRHSVEKIIETQYAIDHHR